MSGQFVKGAVARGMREAGVILRQEGGIEVRCSFDVCTPVMRPVAANGVVALLDGFLSRMELKGHFLGCSCS
jgi:hypothetical protein